MTTTVWIWTTSTTDMRASERYAAQDTQDRCVIWITSLSEAIPGPLLRLLTRFGCHWMDYETILATENAV